MLDLSCWDFSNNFLGYEAAALMQGIDPNYAKADHDEVMIAFERMKEHYELALNEATSFGLGCPDSNGFSATALPSLELVALKRELLAEDDETLHAARIKAKNLKDFNNQKFSRDTLNTWLHSIGLKSIYPFVPIINETAQESVPTRWPWGDHHTELLGHLDAAASKFWGKYDPANPKGTAPKSEEVVRWFVAVCKISNTQATAMATLLRPDGLKTGPRK